MKKTHTTYWMETKNGYTQVTRRIGKRSHTEKTKDRTYLSVVFGLLFGTMAGCLYLQHLGNATTQFIVRALEPEQVVTERVENTDAQVLPTPSPSPNLSEHQQILNYIVEVFGDESHKAIAMLATCENSELDPHATNYNNNGTIDRGIFQINSIHGGEEMFDWKTNIDKAYEIYHAHNDSFYSWTCGNVAGDRTYVDALRGN